MPAPLHQMNQLLRRSWWNAVLRWSVPLPDTLADLVFTPGIWTETHDVTVAVAKTKDSSPASVPTHLRTAPSPWGWPTPRSRSCRCRTSRWRPCECWPGAQVPCSSACRPLSPRLTAHWGSVCGTPPLWVCSSLEIRLNQGLQSRIDRRRLDYHHFAPRLAEEESATGCNAEYTLMWKSLSTKMFSGLMSLWMIPLSVRYNMASRISRTILPLTDRGTGTWKQGRRGKLILIIKVIATKSFPGMKLWGEDFPLRY